MADENSVVEAEWNQQWSHEHSRAYYHNPATQESVWDAPSDGIIHELENIANLKAEAAAAASLRSLPDISSVASLTFSLFLPMMLVLLGLLGLYFYYRTYHPELLAQMSLQRKKRDRSQFRRGRAGPSKFRPPWKMAQAGGAGGRSANS